MASFSLPGLAAHMLVLDKELKQAEQDILKKAAEMVEAEAKAALGTYKFGWQSLQPATIARKAKGDTPLLETGELRASISHTVGVGEAYVGSNDDKAVWQEFGTSHMPPRPFLMPAATRQERAIHTMARKRVAHAFHGAHEFKHILHIAKHAYENVKETIEEFKEGGE
ncbi:HK97-gp10 family putative phage morphogenesis protein [Methylobacterium sp. WL2]|uniref:HK97-gp10 family putative phage morphogenesis protein n=1 Tax=Methylobacterium sp. WL2 TaxID=2603902 RepID=UPI0011CA7AF0|nr:HK97-gp10 family putative phage morphogenesis protein [Methylobacterium sp. WL2]TXN51616.1 hypothetical protein FV241_29985 [Methylobacterium sp. WL2]